MMSTHPYTLKVIGETSAVLRGHQGDISHFDSKIVFLVWMLTPFVGGFSCAERPFFFF